MIESMTGYFKSEKNIDCGAITVTLKSVNGKSCDVYVRAPRCLMEFEQKIITLIKNKLQRGSINLFIEIIGFSDKLPQINEKLISEYIHSLKKIKDTTTDCEFQPIELTNILLLPEAVAVISKPVQLEQFGLNELLEDCIENLIKSRRAEGRNLIVEMENQIICIEQNAELIKKRLPDILKAYKSKLQLLITEYSEDLKIEGEQRVMRELEFFSQRIDVSEELERLSSHASELRKIIFDENENPKGRRIEFILQEMQREINTCSVKTPDIIVSQAVVEVKLMIDRLKEQCMNIV